jgi:uncharacterized membrane protein YraQ (UPF0718 family)
MNRLDQMMNRVIATVVGVTITFAFVFWLFVQSWPYLLAAIVLVGVVRGVWHFSSWDR